METGFKLKLNNNQILSLVILGAVVFFVFILPMIDRMRMNDSKQLKEGLADVKEITKIDTNRCSKQCCKQSQWPVPHDVKAKDMTDEELEKYIGSNFSCNFGSGSGCLCVTKDDFNMLANRGSNATKNMC